MNAKEYATANDYLVKVIILSPFMTINQFGSATLIAFDDYTSLVFEGEKLIVVLLTSKEAAKQHFPEAEELTMGELLARTMS